MSFFKKLFESRKDKYGKGHKLGDKSTQEESQLSQQFNQAVSIPINRPQTSNVQTDAARAAGQAALARLQNSNKI